MNITKWLAIAACCSISQVTSTQAAPVQWATNGHYFEYVPDRLNWSAAQASAASRSFLGMPGYLASVTSAGENDFIKTLLTNAEWGAWLGGSDADQEGTWKWTAGPEAGTPFWIGDAKGSAPNGRYQNWAGFEPNDTNGEDVVAIWGPNGAGGGTYYGTWNDFQASDTQGFVVEYSAVPEPTSLTLATITMAAIGLWVAKRRHLRAINGTR